MSDTSNYSNISEISGTKKQSAVHGYIMTILAGIFLVLAVNFQAAVSFLTAGASDSLEASGSATSMEKADISKIRMEISRNLADSQQAALKEVSQKSERLNSFIATLNGVKLLGSTPSMSNDIIMVGTKKAVNYSAQQSLMIYVTDFSQHQAILKKAAELEISSISPVYFGLTAEKIGAIDEKLLAASLNDALENGKKMARDMGGKLGSAASIDEKGRAGLPGGYLFTDESGASFSDVLKSEDIKMTKTVSVVYKVHH
jgi:uncharacterized protein YggE